MKSSLDKNSDYLNELEKYSATESQKTTDTSAEEFYWFIENNIYVPLDEIEEGMTYLIHMNSGDFSEINNDLFNDKCQTTIATCSKVISMGGVTLLAKFNISGGSNLVTGNYGLKYYCTRILH